MNFTIFGLKTGRAWQCTITVDAGPHSEATVPSCVVSSSPGLSMWRPLLCWAQSLRLRDFFLSEFCSSAWLQGLVWSQLRCQPVFDQRSSPSTSPQSASWPCQRPVWWGKTPEFRLLWNPPGFYSCEASHTSYVCTLFCSPNTASCSLHGWCQYTRHPHPGLCDPPSPTARKLLPLSDS